MAFLNNPDVIIWVHETKCFPSVSQNCKYFFNVTTAWFSNTNWNCHHYFIEVSKHSR